MPISVLNWAVATTVLRQKKLPDATVNKVSILAALVPGVAGLVVPFAYAKKREEDTELTHGGSAPPAKPAPPGGQLLVPQPPAPK